MAHTIRFLRAAAALCASAALLLGGLLPAAATAAKPRTTQVQLLAINDFHGHLQPNTPGTVTLPPTTPGGASTRVPAGGAAYLQTHLKRLEAQNPNSLLISAGDNVSASPLVSALFHDEPTIEAFNLMGFDDSGVGNHEFDHGYRELLRLQDGGCHRDDVCDPDHEFAGADFDYLAANVTKEDGSPILPAYRVERVAGEKIGVIGAVLEETPTIVTPAGVAGLKFLDEVTSINKYVKVLRDQHVDAIVVALHQGGSQEGFFNECQNLTGPVVDIVKGLDKAVDVVLTAHTHNAYNCKIGGKVVTQALSFGRLVTQVKMTFDRATKDLVGLSAKNVPVTQDVTPDREVKALVDKYTEAAAPKANRVIGKVDGDLTRTASAGGETTLGDVIADAQLAATATTGNAVVAFMNPGGIRSDLPASLISGGEQLGEVTYGEAFTVQPFGNSLVTETLTGAQIKDVLEQQFDNPTPGEQRFLQVSKGFTYTWDASKPTGSKVDAASIKIDGTPVDPGANYQVTVNNFLAGGGDKFTTLAAGANPIGGAQDIDAFADYLGANTPLAVPPLDRITRVN